MNDQEQGRIVVNSLIEDSAARMSDFLALQIASEVGNPGSVMCSYNLVNGFYSCENKYLLNEVLKEDWGYKGAQHSADTNARSVIVHLNESALNVLGKSIQY